MPSENTASMDLITMLSVYCIMKMRSLRSNCRDQSSLLLFHKIHCITLSIEKDKYLTLAHSLKTTRSSHSAQ